MTIDPPDLQEGMVLEHVSTYTYTVVRVDPDHFGPGGRGFLVRRHNGFTGHEYDDWFRPNEIATLCSSTGGRFDFKRITHE